MGMPILLITPSTKTAILRHGCCVPAAVAGPPQATLGGVFAGPTPEIPPGFIPDIYNVEPELGFYCLYRPRPGENVSASTIDCGNTTRVARR